MHKTTINLPDAMHARIQARADAQGIYVSEYIRECLAGVLYFELPPEQAQRLRAELRRAREDLRG